MPGKIEVVSCYFESNLRTNGHLYTRAIFFWADGPYILSFFNLSTMATFFDVPKVTIVEFQL